MKDYTELLESWHANEYTSKQLDAFASDMQDQARDALAQASYFNCETNMPLCFADWRDSDAERIVQEHLERALDYATLARMARKLSYIQALEETA